jgi:hypothetical protein
MTFSSWEHSLSSVRPRFGKQERNLSAVFAWSAVQGKAPTTDNLAKKNWPCSPRCYLCYCINETNDHILTECNFAEAVWDKVAQEPRVHPSIAPFSKGGVAGSGVKDQIKETAATKCGDHSYFLVATVEGAQPASV